MLLVSLKMLSEIRMNNVFPYFVMTFRTLVNNKIKDKEATNSLIQEIKVHMLV